MTRTAVQEWEKQQEEVSLNAVAATRQSTLRQILQGPPYHCAPDTLTTALVAGVGEAVAHIAHNLTNYIEHEYAGTTNLSGDEQLQLDIDCDQAVFDACRRAGSTTATTTTGSTTTAGSTAAASAVVESPFYVLATEETPVETVVGNGPYSMACDPLDGSSIIDANLSVGSIFGIWPGKTLVGRTGREQVAACMALYGPRTVLCIALPATTTTTATTAATSSSNSSSTSTTKNHVLEVTLVHNRSAWELSRNCIHLEPAGGKIFAPGNLRATTSHPRYATMIQYWMQHQYQLRYTGGMVPDIYHMFAKSKGIFTNVSSKTAKAKLRLLYEVAPAGLIVECAGGAAICDDQDMSVLDVVIDHTDHRLGVCFGSLAEVEKYKKIMFGESK